MNYDFSVLSDIDFEQMVNKLLNGNSRYDEMKPDQSEDDALRRFDREYVKDDILFRQAV